MEYHKILKKNELQYLKEWTQKQHEYILRTLSSESSL